MNSAVLSRADRNAGIELYRRFLVYTEAGYTFLAESVILLLAIQLGAGNMQLGYLASITYTSGVLVILVPSLFAGMRIVSAFWVLWLIRGLCCLLYFAAAAFSEMPDLALWLLLAGYGAYAVLRNLAWPLKQTLEKILIPDESAGRVLASLNVSMNYGKLAAALLCFFLLASGLFSGLNGLLFLSAVGIFFNSCSALCIRRIPAGDSVESSGGIIGHLIDELKRWKSFPYLLLYCGSVVLSVLIAFIIPLFKSSCGMSMSAIFLFGVFGTLSMILAGKLVKVFSDRTGSRPLLIPCFIFMAAASFIFAFAVLRLHTVLLFVAGVGIVFVQTSIQLLISRLIVRHTPSCRRLGFTSFINLAAAVCSIVAGIAAGASADSELYKSMYLLSPYSMVFIGISIIAALLALASLFILKDTKALELDKACRLFLSTDNLRAFMLLDRLNDPMPDKLKEKVILMNISYTASGLAAEEIRRRLKNPLIDPKDDLMRSLFFFPRPELLEDILAEASDRTSWWRESAIFTLGAYPDKRSEKCLMDVYRNESYPYLRSSAAKSLARIGCVEILPELRETLYSRRGLNVKTMVNLIISISIMDRAGCCLSEIWKMALLEPDSEKFSQHVYIVFSRRIAWASGLEDFFFAENIERGSGLRELINEIVSADEFRSAYEQLVSWTDKREFGALSDYCQKQLKAVSLSGHLKYLADGIITYQGTPRHSSEAMALLYFTYIVLVYQKSGANSFVWKTY